MASEPAMDQMPYLYNHIHIGPANKLPFHSLFRSDDMVLKEYGLY